MMSTNQPLSGGGGGAGWGAPIPALSSPPLQQQLQGTSMGAGGVDTPIGSRLLVCLAPIDYQAHFSFVMEDVRRVLSQCVGPTLNVTTGHCPSTPLPNKPSLAFALVDFVSSTSAGDAVAGLNGTALPHLGMLQLIRLQPGMDHMKTVHAVYESHFNQLPTTVQQPPPQQQQPQQQQVAAVPLGQPTQPPRLSGGTSQALQQLASLLQNPPYEPAGAQGGPTPPPGALAPLPEVPGSTAAATALSPQVYMARLELVELFGHEDFNITQAVLGENDRNIHYILNQADNKVAISLKGVPVNHAPVAERLHMSVTSAAKQHYDRAVEMAEDLLQSVCRQYVHHCVQRRYKVPNSVGFVRHMYVGAGVNEPSDKYTYLGQTERPRVWLEEVPPNLLVTPGSVSSGPVAGQPGGIPSSGGVSGMAQQSAYNPLGGFDQMPSAAGGRGGWGNIPSGGSSGGSATGGPGGGAGGSGAAGRRGSRTGPVAPGGTRQPGLAPSGSGQIVGGRGGFHDGAQW